MNVISLVLSSLPILAWTVLAIIISLFVTLNVCSFSEWLSTHINKTDLNKYRRKGQWAVITGCTRGIGLEFAKQLDSRGFNLVLVARNKEALDDLVKIMGRAVAVQIDFSSQDVDYSELESVLAGKQVSILVNNVGVNYDKPAFFVNLPKKKIDELINVNIKATLDITRTVLSAMVDDSLVVNVSSASSLAPCPLMSIYSATKAFMNSWSDSMNYEYKDRKIHFQCLTPYFITTALSHYSTPTMTIPTPQRYVSSALGYFGRDRCTGYLVHDLMAFVATSIMSHEHIGEYIRHSHLMESREERSG